MFNVKLSEFKGSFFDRAKVMNAAEKGELSVLSKFGAYVRGRAQRSIKDPKRLRESDMTQEQLRSYRIQQSYAKQKGLPKPKRPFAISKPGEPPKNVTGLLKKFIFFAYDINRRSVVSGPALLNGRRRQHQWLATEALEHGNDQIEARPYMTPAFSKELPRVSKLWRDSIK